MTATTSSYSKRFKDIAALFDVAEGESEVTATTSLADRVRGNTSLLDKIQQQFRIGNTTESNNNNHQQQRRNNNNHKQPQQRSSLFQDQLQQQQQQQQRKSYKRSSRELTFVLEQPAQEEEDDRFSQCPSIFGPGDEDDGFSTNAEPYFAAATTNTTPANEKGFFFRDQLQNRLTTTNSNNSNSMQPKELVLNTTDSTDSCTLSEKSLNRNLSYELPSPARSTPQTLTPDRQQSVVDLPPLESISPIASREEEQVPPPAPHRESSRQNWKARQFQRTFRHRANLRKASVLQRTISEDASDDASNDSRFQSDDDDARSETSSRYSSPISKSRVFVDASKLHQRKKNHKVVSYQTIASPVSWWTEMEETVQRYQTTALAKHERLRSDNDLPTIRNSLEEFCAGQNQLGKAMAVALYKGMRLQEAKHAKELEDSRAAHERELAELKNQARTLPSNSNNHRNEAFRQRWRNRMQNNHHASTEEQPIGGMHPTEVASTVVSNMSCRELSVERYRARLLQQMNKGKGKPATTTTTNDDDDACSDTNTTSPSSSSSNNNDNSNNADEIRRLLDELQQSERRQKLLEKQLLQAGVVLAEDIPYQLAKDKVASISKRMNEIGSSEVVREDPDEQKRLREEYFLLEKDMQKYLNALLLTDEYASEKQKEEEAWESRIKVANQRALVAIRKHMPVTLRQSTQTHLETHFGVPKQLVQRFRRTNVLQLLRVDPAVVAKWHPSSLEALRVTGLTLTERRALHAYCLEVSACLDSNTKSTSDPMKSRKTAWLNTLRTNFREALNKHERHLETVPRNSCLWNRCGSIGNQCPVRANKLVDYFSTDLGFPVCGEIYEPPMTIIATDQPKESASEIIARAKGQPERIVVGRKTKPKTTVPKKPVHPLLSAAKKPAPSGLLAAIAARRVD